MSVRAAVGAILVGLFAAGAMAEDRPGQRVEIRFADLPLPGAETPAAAPSQAIARPADAGLSVPEGFRVNVFLDGLAHARWLLVADNGDVFLAEPVAGRIVVLRDSDGDGVADEGGVFLNDLFQPHGMAIHDGFFYVATPTEVTRYPYSEGAFAPDGPGERVGGAYSLGDGRGHWTRNIAVAPDGENFFVAVGSRSNNSIEEAPRATVQRFSIDGEQQATFATGLRNPVGIAFHPDTGELYVVVNERDNFGDRLVPDYLTRVRDGEFFGWPYAYVGPHAAPGLGDRRPDLVAATVAPDVMFEAHSAPLGLAFYDRDGFPERYRGGAFVALHGSWNSSVPTGYKVVFVPFADGRPAGGYENFVTGFRVGDIAPARVWGRPVGVAVAADGSLLIADDVGQVIWRVSYGPE